MSSLARKPTLGSLFSGIGGFELGFERAGFKTLWQVEIDPWARRVLEKNFPHAERFSDIRDCGRINLRPVDVICGGFPCQDISIANTAGAGLDGDRSGLWFEMFRVIRELRPRFAVVENVANLLNRGIERVLGSLAEIGYDAEWEVIPACAIGASHVRERLFIVSYPHSLGLQGRVLNGEGQRIQAFPQEAVRWDLSPPYVCRGADGIPDRAHRLHGLGNAVVPQIPELFARKLAAILDFKTTEPTC